MTVVGDRAQARAGFTESWSQRLARVGVGRLRPALTVNYRTPAEVMAEAEPVIRAVYQTRPCRNPSAGAGGPSSTGTREGSGGHRGGLAGGACAGDRMRDQAPGFASATGPILGP